MNSGLGGDANAVVLGGTNGGNDGSILDNPLATIIPANSSALVPRGPGVRGPGSERISREDLFECPPCLPRRRPRAAGHAGGAAVRDVHPTFFIALPTTRTPTQSPTLRAQRGKHGRTAMVWGRGRRWLPGDVGGAGGTAVLTNSERLTKTQASHAPDVYRMFSVERRSSGCIRVPSSVDKKRKMKG